MPIPEMALLDLFSKIQGHRIPVFPEIARFFWQWRIRYCLKKQPNRVYFYYYRGRNTDPEIKGTGERNSRDLAEPKMKTLRFNRDGSIESDEKNENESTWRLDWWGRLVLYHKSGEKFAIFNWRRKESIFVAVNDLSLPSAPGQLLVPGVVTVDG